MRVRWAWLIPGVVLLLLGALWALQGPGLEIKMVQQYFTPTFAVMTLRVTNQSDKSIQVQFDPAEVQYTDNQGGRYVAQYGLNGPCQLKTASMNLYPKAFGEQMFLLFPASDKYCDSQYAPAIPSGVTTIDAVFGKITYGTDGVHELPGMGWRVSR